MKRVLKDEGVLNTFQTNLQNIPETALKGGNFTTCPSKQTFSKTSSEMTQTTLFFFIRSTQEQEDSWLYSFLFCRPIHRHHVYGGHNQTGQRSNSNLLAHLDATGSIVNKIPNQSKLVFVLGPSFTERWMSNHTCCGNDI